MSLTLQFEEDLERRFYTAYRPIICKVEDLVGDVAYCQANLQRETWTGSGVFADTGIIINGYEDSDMAGVFSFNLMGYVRELISKGIWANFFNSSYYGVGSELGPAFRVEIWAVRYPSVQGDPLFMDVSDSIVSDRFHALAHTTDMTDNYEPDGWPSHHYNIDRIIMGDNGGPWGLKVRNRPNHAKPHWADLYDGNAITSIKQTFDKNRRTAAYTTNMNDTRNLHYVFPTYLERDVWEELWFYWAAINQNGNIGISGFSLWKDFSQPSSRGLQRIPAHPVEFNNFLLINAGYTGSAIIDASGDLVAAGVVIYPYVKHNNGDKMYWTVPGDHPSGNHNNLQIVGHHMAFSDKKNNDKCNRSLFVWKNREGGYDFINIYGPEEKKMSFESTVFDSLPTYHT